METYDEYVARRTEELETEEYYKYLDATYPQDDKNIVGPMSREERIRMYSDEHRIGNSGHSPAYYRFLQEEQGGE